MFHVWFGLALHSSEERAPGGCCPFNLTRTKARRADLQPETYSQKQAVLDPGHICVWGWFVMWHHYSTS